MKAKKFLVILCLLAVALLAVACGEEETTTAEPVVTTTAEATTTAATTTEATTTAATTTAAATTTKATTKATTAAATTTTAATTAAPAPVAPADPYLWNGNVATAFAGGTGTAEDPYQIANGAQLALMAETFEKGAYYILVDDIMLNDVYNWNEWGNGDYLKPLNPWTPIEGFNANFDGKGKTIYGLYGIPLFKSTKDASVTNIGLAYTKVNGAVLIADACDTNIVGITIDTDTLVFNGKDDITFSANATIDDIMAATGTKWYITLGSNPTVWDFEALAVGALATDLYVANDKLGTAFNVTIVDGKGYTEEETDGKKALAWDANDATGNTLVLNITKDATALTNWSGADEVLVYVDGSEQAGAYKFGITLIDAAGKTYTIAKDKNVQTLDGKAWKEFKSTGANFELEDGYTGWVRAPFAAFVDADGKALDAANVNVAQIAFYYENASAVDAGAFYIDSVKILDAEGAWKVLPNTVPTLNPAYGVTVIETFGANTTAIGRIPDNHASNGAAAIKDGEFHLTTPKNAGPDFYIDLNKNINSTLKGFLVYVDFDKVNVVSAGRADGLNNTVYFGLRFIIDGTAYTTGGTIYESQGNHQTNVQSNNISYLQNDNGEWVKVYNSNNNRLVIPTVDLDDNAKKDDKTGYIVGDYFTGWMFIPAENMSKNGHNIEFLDDYLVTKPDGVKLESVLAYTSNLGNGSDLVVDQITAVYGEIAPEAEYVLPENAPATLPNDVDYQIVDTIEFNKAEEIFYVRVGAELVANGGIGDSGAIAVKTKADGAVQEISVNTSKGNNLYTGEEDSGFMFYVDTTGITPVDGAETVGIGIGVAMSYDQQYRNDKSTATNKYNNTDNADNGSYWNFHLGKDGAVGFIQGEDGEWIAVYNRTDYRYFDVPVDYEGYVYVPYSQLYRNGNTINGSTSENKGRQGTLSGNTEGVVYYHWLRFFRVFVAGAKNADDIVYVDDFSVVRANEGFYDNVATDPADYMPATLPEGVEYEVATKVGFESADEFKKISTGNNSTYEFSTDRAVNGNAITLIGDAKGRAETYINIDPILVEGVKGIMFHVDFSSTVGTKNADGSSKTVATITLAHNNFRSNAYEKKGYYLVDGTTEWVETTGSDRMSVPTGFKGWIYIPITSYSGKQIIWDPATGVASDNFATTGFRLYTDGYEFAGAKITFDELTYVK